MMALGSQAYDHSAGANSIGVSPWAPPRAQHLTLGCGQPSSLAPSSVSSQLKRVWCPLGASLSQTPLSLHLGNPCFVFLFLVPRICSHRAGRRRPGEGSYIGAGASRVPRCPLRACDVSKERQQSETSCLCSRMAPWPWHKDPSVLKLRYR